jgi:hypothetical protein
MDENKFRIAISLLQAIAEMLPDGDVEEKYVEMYHSTLTNIQDETGHDLTAFFIPQSEIKPHLVATGFSRSPVLHQRRSQPENRYSQEHYCDEARFLIALKGAINYLNSWVLFPSGFTINLAKPK